MTSGRRLKRLAAHIVALAASSSGWTVRRRSAGRGSRSRLFILEYHSVTTNRNEPEGQIHLERFSRHVHWLKRRFELVTVSQGYGRLGEASGKKDLLAVTFDDGYIDNYEIAWPILRATKSSATFFLTTGFLDGDPLWFEVALRCLSEARSGALDQTSTSDLDDVFGPGWQRQRDHETIERIKRLPGAEFQQAVARLMELRNNYGWQTSPDAVAMSWQNARTLSEQGGELGAHTSTHPILSSLDEAQQRIEIETSKDRVETEVAMPCRLFAYPNGSRRDFNEATVRLVGEAGFSAACTTIRGSNTQGVDPMQLRRIGIGPDPTYLLDARLAGLFDDAVRRRMKGGGRP